jgi:hypothetical protein
MEATGSNVQTTVMLNSPEKKSKTQKNSYSNWYMTLTHKDFLWEMSFCTDILGKTLQLCSGTPFWLISL